MENIMDPGSLTVIVVLVLCEYRAYILLLDILLFILNIPLFILNIPLFITSIFHSISDNEKKIKQGWGEPGAAEFQG